MTVGGGKLFLQLQPSQRNDVMRNNYAFPHQWPTANIIQIMVASNASAWCIIVLWGLMLILFLSLLFVVVVGNGRIVTTTTMAMAMGRPTAGRSFVGW